MDEFKLEVFFAKYEFSARHLLCCSDAETISMSELITMADSESLSLWSDLRLGYTEARGMPLLRQEIAKDYRGLNSDNILCFAGSEEGIYCTLVTLLTKNDHIIVLTPCYQSLRSIAEVICDVTTVNLTPNSWKIDFDLLRASIIPSRTKLIVINFPHNPTGATLSLSEQTELIALANEYGLWLFSDEVYRGLQIVDDSTDSVILPPIASVYEKGISLGGMSKLYGLAGLRVGWIVTGNFEQLSLISSNKHYMSICNSAPSEILTLIALRAKDRIIARNLEIIQSNLLILDKFLIKYNHLFSWTKPKASCCGFIKIISNDDSLELNSIAEKLVNEYGVLILPGDNFLNDKNNENNSHEVEAYSKNIRNHFRIGFGRRNFPIALQAFEDILSQ
eukprot:gene6519-8959_t